LIPKFQICSPERGHDLIHIQSPDSRQNQHISDADELRPDVSPDHQDRTSERYLSSSLPVYARDQRQFCRILLLLLDPVEHILPFHKTSHDCSMQQLNLNMHPETNVAGDICPTFAWSHIN
jgi:hypothetical protein